MKPSEEPTLEAIWSSMGGRWRDAMPDAAQNFASIDEFLAGERAARCQVLPPRAEVFRAFELTPPISVRAVVLGQDPYPTPGFAHGLSFSVQPGVAVPASLRNIYTELENEVPFTRPRHGNLETWARNGILLLNSALTVRAHEPGSHVDQGWERFTDDVISLLGSRPDPTVFFLWGNEARARAGLIKGGQHLVIQTSHPSDQGAWQGFRGSGQFRRANEFLVEQGLQPIDWSLPDLAPQQESL